MRYRYSDIAFQLALCALLFVVSEAVKGEGSSDKDSSLDKTLGKFKACFGANITPEVAENKFKHAIRNSGIHIPENEVDELLNKHDGKSEKSTVSRIFDAAGKLGAKYGPKLMKGLVKFLETECNEGGEGGGDFGFDGGE